MNTCTVHMRTKAAGHAQQFLRYCSKAMAVRSMDWCSARKHLALCDRCCAECCLAIQGAQPLLSGQHSTVPFNKLDTAVQIDSPLFQGSVVVLFQEPAQHPSGHVPGPAAADVVQCAG